MRAALAMLIANACYFMSTCSVPPNQLDLILATGNLNVVTRNSATTYYLGSEGPAGFEYDLVRGFADDLGVTLNIYTAEHFNDILADVRDWRADIAAAGLTVTPERGQVVRFADPYLAVRQQLIYRLGHRRPRGPEDLVGKRLVISAGSSFVSSLNLLAAEFEGLSWEEAATADVQELVEQLVAGDIDFTVIDSNEFEIASQFFPEIRVAFDISETTELAWALRQGEDTSLYDAVQRYLTETRASGELARIDRHYYDNSHRLDYVGTRRFLRHIDSRLPHFRDNFERIARDTGEDWRLLAALGYQESHWNPDAVSPTGVRGLMMLTRATAVQMGVEDRTDPAQSIDGGARYLARVRNKIPARIPEPDRTYLALAAYNVGFQHLEDARILTQRQGMNPDSWDDVRKHLPLLAQKKWYTQVRRGYARGWEPVRYVDNIRSYYNILTWATSDQYPGVQQARQDEPIEAAPAGESPAL